jgi:hypothetical protein
MVDLHAAVISLSGEIKYILYPKVGEKPVLGSFIGNVILPIALG